MSKLTCNCKLYKVRLVNNTPLIFGGTTFSEEWDAPCKAILNDYHQKVVFEFVHPKDNGKKYKRHYDRPAYDGYAELKVGRFRTGDDCANVFINIASVSYGPYVVFDEIEPAFSSAELLAEIVARAINWVLRNKMLKVELVPWEPDEGEKVFWAKDCYDTYKACQKKCKTDELKDFGFEKLNNANRKRKTGTFKSYILYGYENKVMEWLHPMIGNDSTDIPKFMLPMRASAELKLLNARPPLDIFCKAFGKEGLIKKTAYNDYMNYLNAKCDKDNDIKDEYEAILDSAKAFFGIE